MVVTMSDLSNAYRFFRENPINTFVFFQLTTRWNNEIRI